ncbi:MAG: vWA domain-containing protein [Acidiferrobacterales bacterium]
MSEDAIAKKLAAARTRLILDKPFLGALVMRLPMVAADPAWCQNAATDARKFYYNRNYIKELSLQQVQFVLAHEALHCALSHFARRQHRDKHRWDVACDFAINPLLINDGLVPVPEALHLPEYEGMTAEEIYPLIDENSEQEPMDQHLYDNERSDDGQSSPQNMSDDEGDSDKDRGNDGDQPKDPPQNDSGGSGGQPDTQQNGASRPPPLTENERETLAVQWQQRMAGAAQQAMQAGKLGGAMARMVDHLLQPQLPWRMLLARYMTAVARDDYSFLRPSNRREGDAILPSLRSTQAELTVTLDTSGSISDKEMQEFISEINAIKGQVRARLSVLACDAAVNEQCPWRFEPWEEVELPNSMNGGGGTDFRPPFEFVEKQDQQPDLMVYFTDAEGEFPKNPPPYPVIWLVKGKNPVPWGQRIQLN